MSSDTIDWYLQSIGRVPLLTADQEITLGRQVQEWMALKKFLKNQGKDEQLSLLTTEVQFDHSGLTEKEQKRIMRAGKRAFERLYSANLRLVVSVAKKYTGLTVNLDMSDLIQEGNVGLARAVEKFDPTLGYKFSTYSYWWIRQGITRGISQTDHTIRLPIHAYEKVGKIRKFSRDYNQQFGYMPPTQVICDTFKLTPEELDRMNMVAIGCVSLHSTARRSKQMGANDSSMLMDIIPAPEPDEQPFDCIEKQIVEEVLPSIKEQMTEMEGKVFEAAFFTQRQDSRAQIARDLGITGERARQLENRSTSRFKTLFRLRYEAAAC